jgi:sulfur carrier protein
MRVNGESRSVRAETVEALLAELGFEAGRRGIAVAVDGALVPRRNWGDARLSAARSVEIISASQGG